MDRKLPILLAIIILLTSYAVSGCAVYDVIVEERNVSTYSKDKKISYLIEEKFLDDKDITFLDFDAYCYEGHAYVIGEYERHEQADKAAQIARKTPGVHTVTTYFLPKSPNDNCGTTDNMEISAALRQKLIADNEIWSTNIDVEMVQCHVVLLGLVGSKQAKDKAIAYARAIPGVRGVKSFIQVK